MSITPTATAILRSVLAVLELVDGVDVLSPGDVAMAAAVSSTLATNTEIITPSASDVVVLLLRAVALTNSAAAAASPSQGSTQVAVAASEVASAVTSVLLSQLSSVTPALEVQSGGAALDRAFLSVSTRQDRGRGGGITGELSRRRSSWLVTCLLDLVSCHCCAIVAAVGDSITT